MTRAIVDIRQRLTDEYRLERTTVQCDRIQRMDGITFLKKVMAERPTPVVICSSISQKGSETAMQALAAGAVGIVPKPGIGNRRAALEDAASDLIRAVKAAAHANVRNLKLNGAAPPVAVMPKLSADAILPATSQAMAQTTERIVAIGTSTGGTQALEAVLTALPRVSPGIVIVQHMPEKFTASFAARLDTLCQIEVREAQNGDRVIPGRALIAPGGKHMLLKRNGSQYHVEVVVGPVVNRHRPSVDVLFRSVAKFAGRNALGVIMTGMGDSCQFDTFTLHASGHNPREHQHQRWRNRFMCKFNFFPDKFSGKGCVGCGRCIRVCPVRLDITEVMQEFSK